MCDEHKKCQNHQKPKDLTGKPENCSDEQVKKCHGNVKEHPCTKKDDKK